MNPGIYIDLPAPEYRAAPGLCHSALRHIDQTPAHFRAALEYPKPQTPAMRLGTLAHEAILTGGQAQTLVAPPPTYTDDKGAEKSWNWNASACKAWRAAVEAEGRTVVSQDDLDAIKGMVDACRNSRTVQTILKGADTEVSWFADRNGVRVKGRIDIVPAHSDALVDLKTMPDVSDAAITRAVEDMGMETQGAWYRWGWNACRPEDKRRHHVIIFVQNQPPYAVRVLKLSDDYLWVAERRIQRWLETYMRCIERDEWPGYPDDVGILNPTMWYLRRNGGDE